MKKILCVPILLILALLVMGAAPPEVYFQMKDPVGDEHGYGTYQYPGNIAFKPYKGLFDITEFKVWSERPGDTYFDTSFVDNTNPWMAPEGFIHQNIRIFIDSVAGQGLADLTRPGAYVKFNPKFAWDACLRVAGWGNSQLITVSGGKVQTSPLRTEILGDNRTIRAVLPEGLLGKPTRGWKYYVLVGSYDGFGEDFFRRVMKNPGDWVIGGGTDEIVEPQVLDILASDVNSQVKQLRSFDPATGRLAQLEPVGPGRMGMNIWGWLFKILGTLIAAAILYLIYRLVIRDGKISWFWVKNRNTEEKKGV